MMFNIALFSEYKFTTVNTPYIFTINQPIAPHIYPFKGKIDLTFKPKSNFGFHKTYSLAHGAEIHMASDHNVTVINNDNEFDIKGLHKTIKIDTVKTPFWLPSPMNMFG